MKVQIISVDEIIISVDETLPFSDSDMILNY